MKKLIVLVAAALALSAPMTLLAAGGHGDMKMDHGSHSGDVAHEEVINGVKATFKVMSMKEHMKTMNMELPKGLKETHHIAVEFKDAKTGKALTEGDVKVKVQGPDKAEQTKDMMGMEGHFGADFEMAKKGKYGVMSKFKLKDGQVRSSRFWYTVK